MQTIKNFINKNRARKYIFFSTIFLTILFSVIFIYQNNTEFLIYVGTIILFSYLILISDRYIDYPIPTLLGLELWALMHVAGGGIIIKNEVLYKLMIIELPVSLPLLRYDQIVHFIGFGITTLLIAHLLDPLLIKPITKHYRLAIIVILAGMGAGALNEIIEFILTISLPNTNVGGYINTSLDLVFNTLGAITAYAYLRHKQN